MTHENSIPPICLPPKRSFLNIPPFSSFQIGSITQNGNPETPEIINSLKMLIFFFKLSKTLFTYAKTIILRLWILLNSTNSTNLQHNFYCFLLIKSLTRFNFLVLLKLQDQFWLVKIAPQKLRFSKFSVVWVFSNWHRPEWVKTENWKHRRFFKSLKSLNFFAKLNFLCQDFTYIQSTYVRKITLTV